MSLQSFRVFDGCSLGVLTTQYLLSVTNSNAVVIKIERKWYKINKLKYKTIFVDRNRKIRPLERISHWYWWIVVSRYSNTLHCWNATFHTQRICFGWSFKCVDFSLGSNVNGIENANTCLLGVHNLKIDRPPNAREKRKHDWFMDLNRISFELFTCASDHFHRAIHSLISYPNPMEADNFRKFSLNWRFSLLNCVK